MAESRQLLQAGAAKRPLFVGVDLGGTNIKAGVVDVAGGVLSCHSIPTQVVQGPASGAQRIAASIIDVIERAGLAPQDILHVGLAGPGGLDSRGGKLIDPTNLPGWGDFPLRDAVALASGLPVSLFNDGAAATHGEFWVGTAQAFASMVMFTLGTGVGGGIIVDGKPIPGEHGLGTELGHIVIDYNDNARPCSCGQRGHLEAYASAPAVVRRAAEKLAGATAGPLPDRLAAGEELTTRLIATQAEAGDTLSLEIVLETARLLAIGVVTMLHAIDPGIVVLGGAMTFGGPTSPLGRRFLEEIRQEVRRRALPPVCETAIEFASLGSEAGLIGAAGLAQAAEA